MQKNVLFRPTGGEITCQVNDRVTPVMLHALCGRSSNQAFHPLNGRVACGSMVLLVFLFQKIHNMNFLKQDRVSSAWPEAISPARCRIA